MRINPGLHVVDLSSSVRQIGLGEGALVLKGLQPHDLAFLAALRSGLDDGTETAAADRCGVPATRAGALLAALDAVLLPWPGPAGHGQVQQGPEVPALRAERLGPDTARLAAAYRVDGTQFVRSRARAAVEISGLGRTGALLARTLAAAGVGTLILADPAVVRPTDVGPAYAFTDLGMGRAAAVKRHIYRVDPTIQVLVLASGSVRPPTAHLDLSVCIGGPPLAGWTPGSSPRDYPQLTVTLQETGVDVGPLVVPGITPCLECLERHCADSDSGWYAAAEALSRGVSNAEAAGEETAAGMQAAGAAAVQVLAFLDNVVQPATWSAVLQLRAADGYPGLKRVAFHPGCGCRLQRHGHAVRAS